MENTALIDMQRSMTLQKSGSCNSVQRAERDVSFQDKMRTKGVQREVQTEIPNPLNCASPQSQCGWTLYCAVVDHLTKHQSVASDCHCSFAFGKSYVPGLVNFSYFCSILSFHAPATCLPRV